MTGDNGESVYKLAKGLIEYKEKLKKGAEPKLEEAISNDFRERMINRRTGHAATDVSQAVGAPYKSYGLGGPDNVTYDSPSNVSISAKLARLYRDLAKE